MNRSRLVVACTLLSFLGAACAHAPAPTPVRVRIAELGTIPVEELQAGRPLVIEIREGEVIPLDVVVDGDLVASARDTPPIALVAKRTFFVRITSEGLALSRDGEHFGVKGRVPGRFRMGVSATRERGLRGEIELTTPRP